MIREDPAAPSPGRRLTMSRLMVLVASAGWASLNLRAWVALEAGLPPGTPGRVGTCRALAWVIGPAAGAMAARRIWRGLTGPVDSTRMAARRGMLAGAGSGGLAWFLVMILLCIGHGADGQTPPVALILAGAGAAGNFPAGATLGVLWWWARPRGGAGGPTIRLGADSD